MARQLTQLQRAIAIGQLQAGRRQRDVAMNIGVNQCTINNLWRKYQRTGDVKDMPGALKLQLSEKTDSLFEQLEINPFPHVYFKLFSVVNLNFFSDF